MPMDPATLVGTLIDRLTDSYIFPDRARAAAQLLHSRLSSGAYPDDVGPTLCEQLSADLRATCQDKHLRVLWHDDAEASRDEAELVAAMLEEFQRENHGLQRVELLDGNIGLITLTLVPSASLAAEKLAAAMSLVQHTDALILDLREARGGSPDGVAFLCSYFFPDDETHLNDIVEGPSGPTRQYWTASHLPGARYLDRTVYVLTSPTTFSGGEELAYDLQALGRAILVGEPTRGGAHPSKVLSLDEHVELRLPVARSLNPHTHANWEGGGVLPDVNVPAVDACRTAHKAALSGTAADLPLLG